MVDEFVPRDPDQPSHAQHRRARADCGHHGKEGLRREILRERGVATTRHNAAVPDVDAVGRRSGCDTTVNAAEQRVRVRQSRG